MKNILSTSTLLVSSLLAAFVSADGCGSNPTYPDGNPNKYVLRKEGSPCQETTGACSCNGDDIVQCIGGVWLKSFSCIDDDNLICITNSGTESCAPRTS